MKKIDDSKLGEIDGAGTPVRPSLDMDSEFAPVKSGDRPGAPGGPGGPVENPDTAGGGDDTDGGFTGLQE